MNSVKDLLPDYFKRFSWTDIPNFSVITGKNGVGKSKLLKIIRYKLNLERLNKAKLSDVSITIDQNKLKKISIPTNREIENVDIKSDIRCYIIHFDGNFSDLKGESYDQNDRNRDANHKEVHFFKMQNYEIEMNEGSILQINGLIKFIKNSYNDQQNLNILNEKLNDDNLFSSRIEIEKSIKKNTSLNFNLSGLNNLDILNYSIEKIKEDFQVKINFNSEIDQSSLNNPDFKISYNDENYVVKKDEKLIELNQLSCGEQIILYFKLWSIIANDKNLKESFLKKFQNILLLLEEPDSFLNPALLNSLVKIIAKDIADKLNIQIIMTTHNPTTISFVQKIRSLEEIFVLSHSQNKYLQIERCTDWKVFSKLINNELNSNLINIHIPYKIVFIEGNDKEIYNIFIDKLKEFKLFNNDVQIILRPIAGASSCCEQIKKLINSIDERNLRDENQKLSTLIYGIIDNDGRYTKDDIKVDNQKENLLHLKRNGIENYIYDPINLLYNFISEIKDKFIIDNFKSYENLKNQIYNFDDKTILETNLNNVIKYVKDEIIKFLFDDSTEPTRFLDKKYKFLNYHYYPYISCSSYGEYYNSQDHYVKLSKFKVEVDKQINANVNKQFNLNDHKSLIDEETINHESKNKPSESLKDAIVNSIKKLTFDKPNLESLKKKVDDLLEGSNDNSIKKENYCAAIRDIYSEECECECEYFLGINNLPNSNSKSIVVNLKVPKLFYLIDDHDYQKLINQVLIKENKKIKIENMENMIIIDDIKEIFTKILE